MKKLKVLVTCNCCGAKVKEKKAHYDIPTGKWYCTPCYRAFLKAIYNWKEEYHKPKFKRRKSR